MASDRREERSVSISLPAELDDWLDERASALDVDRETLLVQLLAAYQAAETGDAAADPIEDAVASATEDVEDRLGERLDDLEEEFQSKIVDVRERVIQVKQETDAKAPADHTHEELEEVETLATVVEALEDSVDELEQRQQSAIEELRADLEDDLAAAAEDREAMAERLDDAEDKLRRVAWVVSDLKDDVGSEDAHRQAVDRIKRAAAQEGVTTASCDSCGEAVDIALLTQPECPHCEATVSDVRPGGGIIRNKARLVAAAQLESGEEDT